MSVAKRNMEGLKERARNRRAAKRVKENLPPLIPGILSEATEPPDGGGEASGQAPEFVDRRRLNPERRMPMDHDS